MRKQSIYSIVRLTVILLLFCISQVACAGKSFLWQVDNGKSTVYLLGSIHMGVPAMYPLPAVIQKAYRNSDAIVVEVNESASNPLVVQQKMQTMGMYPGTETIADHVDKTTYQSLSRYLQKSGMPPQMFIKMKPGLIAITLSVVQLQQLGYSPDLGVDRHFIEKANQDHKPILELETIDQQLSLLLNFSDDALLLKHTMSQLDIMKDVTEHMIQAWQQGNAEKLKTLMLVDPIKDNPEYRPLMKALITNRNYTMAAKVNAYLTSGKHYLVIVGAGHLVGDEGIIAILKQKGFKVVQL